MGFEGKKLIRAETHACSTVVAVGNGTGQSQMLAMLLWLQLSVQSVTVPR